MDIHTKILARALLDCDDKKCCLCTKCLAHIRLILGLTELGWETNELYGTTYNPETDKFEKPDGRRI